MGRKRNVSFGPRQNHRTKPSERQTKDHRNDAHTSRDKTMTPGDAPKNQTNTRAGGNPPDVPDQHTINEGLIANWTRRVGIFTGLLVAVTALLVVVTGVSAYFLWESDAAIWGQLDAMQRDQAPYVSISPGTLPPAFQIHDGVGRIYWTWHYTNFGTGRAIDVKNAGYMKVGEGQFKRSNGSTGLAFAGDIPEGKDNFGTVASADPVTADEANKLLITDTGVELLLEFQYRDVFGAKLFHYDCLGHLANQALILLNPDDCEKQKAQ
jgi:hypothetical protein